MRYPTFVDIETDLPIVGGRPHKSYLEELSKIAQAGPLALFVSLDKLANVMGGNPPGGNPGGASAMSAPAASAPKIQPSATGATSMGGMSTHCDRCFCEIKGKGHRQCPKCGNPIKAVRDIKSAPPERRGEERVELGDTGGEAAVNEELADSGDSDKNAAAIHPLLMKLQGAAAIGGGTYVGIKGGKEVKKLLDAGKEKQARASHAANPVFNLAKRGRKVSSVSDFQQKFKGATKRFTSKSLSLVP